MKVLYLGEGDGPLVEYLKGMGEDVVCFTGLLQEAEVRLRNPDFIVSYGYRHIIPANIIAQHRDRAINLHIAYLPWNRGADPNLWSIVDDTPKGVTIHYMDEGVDTGDIIVQKPVSVFETDTLRTSYARLQTELQMLFRTNWATIRIGECSRQKQGNHGSYHRSMDLQKICHLLTKGWDTPITNLRPNAKC
jgi:methionyl-tRNA formyltransferase